MPSTSGYRSQARTVGERAGSGAGGAQLRAGALQIGGHAHQDQLAIGDRVVELLQRNVERSESGMLDRAILEAGQRIAQDLVGLTLQLIELLGRIALAR